ncbi:MAG: class I SAM-dependent methyltransferase [bacterium]|nr:class I SAM-dependent methyltransferase [bacterium]
MDRDITSVVKKGTDRKSIMDSCKEYLQKKIDLTKKNRNYSKIVALIGRDKRVIDFGCGSGYFTKILKDKGCRVTCIDILEAEARKAIPFSENVIIHDIDTINLKEQLNGKYDVALFADVLEHLKYPERILLQTKRFLHPHGSIVISVPNIAHVTIRLALLMGKFNYQKRGILDRTHLKHFTRESILRLLVECGYRAQSIDGTILGVSHFYIESVAKTIGVDNIKKFEEYLLKGDALVGQFVIKASVADYIPKSLDVPEINEQFIDYENVKSYVLDLERKISFLSKRKIERVFTFVRNCLRKYKQ